MWAGEGVKAEVLLPVRCVYCEVSWLCLFLGFKVIWGHEAFLLTGCILRNKNSQLHSTSICEMLLINAGFDWLTQWEHLTACSGTSYTWPLWAFCLSLIPPSSRYLSVWFICLRSFKVLNAHFSALLSVPLPHYSVSSLSHLLHLVLLSIIILFHLPKDVGCIIFVQEITSPPKIMINEAPLLSGSGWQMHLSSRNMNLLIKSSFSNTYYLFLPTLNFPPWCSHSSFVFAFFFLSSQWI